MSRRPQRQLQPLSAAADARARNFAQAMINWRTAHDYSLREAAARLAVSPEFLGDIELAGMDPNYMTCTLGTRIEQATQLSGHALGFSYAAAEDPIPPAPPEFGSRPWDVTIARRREGGHDVALRMMRRDQLLDADACAALIADLQKHLDLARS